MFLTLKILALLVTSLVGWLLAVLQFKTKWKDGRTIIGRSGRRVLFWILPLGFVLSISLIFVDHYETEEARHRAHIERDEIKVMLKPFLNKAVMAFPDLPQEEALRSLAARLDTMGRRLSAEEDRVHSSSIDIELIFGPSIRGNLDDLYVDGHRDQCRLSVPQTPMLSYISVVSQSRARYTGNQWVYTFRADLNEGLESVTLSRLHNKVELSILIGPIAKILDQFAGDAEWRLERFTAVLYANGTVISQVERYCSIVVTKENQAVNTSLLSRKSKTRHSS